MKFFSVNSLSLKLLLVPVVATVSFAAYLVYSSLVLSGGNELLVELRDIDLPIVDAADKNLYDHDRIVDALDTAAATGELDVLEMAKARAASIQDRYQKLETIDTERKDQVEKLKTEFIAYFNMALEVAQQMATRMSPALADKIIKMRNARDTYLNDSLAYKHLAEKDFQDDVTKAIARSARAQTFGVGIGTLMLVIIVLLSVLVTRGILKLENTVLERNTLLAAVNSELEYEILKLTEAEEAKSQALEASHIKDEFLANMSHELRTPMNAVIGLSHLCLQTDMSLKQRDYLQKIHGASKSLLAILNDILDISKIEAGKMEMDQIPFDLEEVMGNLATILGHKAVEKNLEFVLDTAPDVPSRLVGDPLRLSQVLINLAGNAIKFTEQGEVVVRAEIEQDADGLVGLRFTIKDTGIGMSQQDMAKLFRPFTQADSSITRRFGGTGLGLTISKRLAEMMGGTIRVESVMGSGSTFVFTARFRKAEMHASLRQAARGNLNNLRVLAVDDNDSSLQIMRAYLDEAFSSVAVAGNGEDALNLVRRTIDDGNPFDLIIIDWKMPQMDGIELARQLKNLPGLRTKPKLLLVSAHLQNGMLPPLEEHLVDGILAKPIQPSSLIDAISRIFSQDLSASGRFVIGAQFNSELVSQISGARILLVEDNEINQQVAQELLESLGISVMIADNGRDALDLLQDEHFDGVLMDIQMPVMDGVSATREIRKNPDFSALPVIALTANVMVSEQNEFLEAGMNDHIGKPIDPDRLVVTLAKWIHPARPGNSPAVVQRPAPAKAPDQLPELPGVQVKESVRRLGGNVSLYLTLIDRFRTNQRDFVETIRGTLAAHDQNVSERMAHTLRGLAGTIGAVTLQQQASLLEGSIKNGAFDEAAPLLEQIEPELGQLIASIDHALETAKSTA